MGQFYQSPEQWLAYYQAAGRKAGLCYYTLKVLQIVSAAAIPILLSTTKSDPDGTFIASLLGAFVVVAESALQLFQFHKTYVNFQDAAERVRIQTYLARNKTGAYAGLTDERVEQRLATQIGEIALAEHGRWGTIVSASDAPSDSAGKPS